MYKIVIAGLLTISLSQLKAKELDSLFVYSLSRAQHFASMQQLDSANWYFNRAFKNKSPQNIDLWYQQIRRLGKAYEPDNAIIHYLNAAKKLDNNIPKEDVLRARLLAYAGNIHRKAGRYHRAITYFEEALSTFHQHGTKDLNVARICHYSGTIYIRQGDYDKAIGWLTRAIELSLELEEYEKAAAVYSDLGIVYRDLQQWGKMLECFDNGLSLPNISTLQKANLQLNRAEYLSHQKLWSEAKPEVLRALTAYQSVDPPYLPGMCASYESLGNIHRENDNWKDAHHYYQQALEVGLTYYGPNHRSIARILLELAQVEEHGQHYQKALYYTQKGLHALIPGFNDTLGLSNPTQDQCYPEPWIVIALEKKAALLRILSQESNQETQLLEQSLKTYNLVITQIDALRNTYTYSSSRTRLVNSHYNAFGSAIATSLQLALLFPQKQAYYFEEAFHYAERGKAYALRRSLSDAQARLRGDIPDSLFQQEQYLYSKVEENKKQLTLSKELGNNEQLSKRLNESKLEYDQLIHEITRQYPQYKRWHRPDRTLSLDSIRNGLQPDEIVLEYYHGQKTIYLFALSAHNLSVYIVNDSKKVEQEIRQLHNALSRPPHGISISSSYQAFTKPARSLYQSLLASSLNEHPQVKTLIIIPDGLLGLIPFEVLLDSSYGDVPKFENLPYIFRNHNIRYHYSASLLTSSSTTQNEARILAFAPEASFGTDNLSGSKKELESISSLFPGTYLYDDKADKNTFLDKADKYAFLHIASHGQVSLKHPALSNLSFWVADSTDHKLYAYELHGMSLNADLVVLSACETGYGKWQKGDGIMSLTHGFMSAGAQNVTMSLWRVEDNSNAEFMYHFYSGLSEGLNVTSALQKSRGAMLNTSNPLFRHPYYWAAFVSYGQEKAFRSSSFLYDYTFISIGIVVFVLLLVLFIAQFLRKPHT